MFTGRYMKEVLEQLIRLQQIDARLLEIEEYKGDLPEKVRHMDTELATMSKELETGRLRLVEIERELRQHYAEIQDGSAKLNKYKDQLYLVTTNKEYDALLSEIDGIKNKISDSETEILNLEEEKSQLEEDSKSITMRKDETKVILKKSKKELGKALAETESEEAELKKQRVSCVAVIDKSELRAYERMRGARDGFGIISISRQACGNCFYHLPPQTIIEIKRRDKLMTYPSCGIFLYYDPIEDD